MRYNLATSLLFTSGVFTLVFLLLESRTRKTLLRLRKTRAVSALSVGLVSFALARTLGKSVPGLVDEDPVGAFAVLLMGLGLLLTSGASFWFTRKLAKGPGRKPSVPGE